MSNGTAPVCPISRNQPVPGLILTTIPPITLVNNLPTAIAAIQQINAIMRQLGPGIPTNGSPRAPIATGSAGTQGSSKFSVHWTEESREMELVDLCDPDGNPDTDFVTVPRITKVTFGSPGALIKLVWQLRP